MTDWKSMFFRLVELARPEKIVNDEAEIIGWATNEAGQHYPIHAAGGGGGAATKSESRPKFNITESKSKTSQGDSTFFQLDSDMMDVSGHIPKNGIPFIDNLWYSEKYASDPTDASTISKEVKGKGNAKNHMLSAIDYFRRKGYDKFEIKIMSSDSHKLMERMEKEGYVQALNKWQEGDDVTYKIKK